MTGSLSIEYETLLLLLRTTLGTQTGAVLPQEVSWKKVAKLSARNKVSCLAFDGLPEQYRAKFASWAKLVGDKELWYEYSCDLLTTVVRLLVEQGFKPIILKGYGMSLDYPNPCHRGDGDIDIYLLDSKGRPAARRGVKVLEEAFNLKSRRVPHDYELTLKGIVLEMHYSPTSEVWSIPSEKHVVRSLERMIPDGIVPCPGIPGAYLPSPTFNALFLIRHMFVHLYSCTFILRQCTDWILFLQKHSAEVDWTLVERELVASGMKPFFDGLMTMLERRLGLDRSLCPIVGSSDLTEFFTVSFLENPGGFDTHLLKRWGCYRKNRDKLRFLTGKGWFTLLLSSYASSLEFMFSSALTRLVPEKGSPEPDNENRMLLKLLRIAIGTDDAVPSPASVDWKKVVMLSFANKVNALAVDGLRQSMASDGPVLRPRRAEELSSVLKPWIEQVNATEQGCKYYLEVLVTLCNLFIGKGLTPIILKGYGLGLNYPNPIHRGAGDVDLFLLDADGRPAAEQGVRIVEELFGIRAVKVPHDYEFSFKGVEVELHYDTTNAYWDKPSEHYVVRRLTELLVQGIVPCPDIQGAYLPGSTFNALYLVRHIFGHFYSASVTFRQYADFILFLQKHSSEVDWPLVERELELSGMKPFFDGLMTMLGRRLGLDRSLCPIKGSNDITEHCAVCDLLRGAPLREEENHDRACYYWANRRKLRLLTGRSWLSLLLRHWFDYIKAVLRIR